MAPTLRTPSERTCERCGREEVWDEERETWRVAREAGEPVVGSPYCIHEWDINGSFVPFERTGGAAEA
ncbi:MAG: HEWD family protein [Haloquadratum sp.]